MTIRELENIVEELQLSLSLDPPGPTDGGDLEDLLREWGEPPLTDPKPLPPCPPWGYSASELRKRLGQKSRGFPSIAIARAMERGQTFFTVAHPNPALRRWTWKGEGANRRFFAMESQKE